jgi:SAM-dependent methyltransferase
VNLDPKARFSDRVDDYRKYRPGYPPEVLNVLGERCGLGPASVVADIGSGTGILTALLLDKAASVFAVEPNSPMRAAAEVALGSRPGFRSIPGSAEATTLPDASVDLVTAAQAFHWFDPVVHRSGFAEEVVRTFYLPGKVDRIDVIMAQEFDYDGVRGRLLSSSYAPKEGQPDHDGLFGELRRLFDRHAVDGRVTFGYVTRIFVPR